MTRQHWSLPTLIALPLLAAVVWLMLAIARDGGPTEGEPSMPAVVDRSAAATSPDARSGAVDRARVDVLEAAQPGMLRVQGRVLDAYGEPVHSALVGEVAAERPARTTSDGQFELLAMPGHASSLTLLVLATGHAPLLSQHEIAGASGLVAAGDIHLLRGGGIRGQVTDAAGKGLPGATVAPRARSRGSWPASLDPDALFEPATTDADGAYSFTNLVPGAYEVAAAAPGMQAGRTGTVTVRDGDETRADPIALEVGHRLAGIVFGPGDVPLPGAVVQIRSSGNQRRHEGTEAGADGRFELGSLPPGSLHVDVTRPGFLRYTRSDVDAVRDEELVVRLERGLSITGIVVDAVTGRPVERFAAVTRPIGPLDGTSPGTMPQQLERRVEALAASAAGATDAELRDRTLRLRTELEARLARIRQDAPARPVPVPADVGPVLERPGGKLAFEGLEEGLWSVGVSSPQHRFAQVEPIALRRGFQSPELRLELVAGHTLSGVVVSKHDGAAIGGATVELLRVQEGSRQPQDAGRSLYPWLFARPGPKGATVMVARTGGDGRFELRQAAPGRCLLSVRQARIADHETDVFELRGGLEIRVEVGATASLTGRVGNVAPGQESNVEVLVLGGHGMLRTAKAGAGGAYRFDGLQPGSYLVRAFPSAATQYVDRLFASIFPLHAGAVDPEKIPRRDVTLAEGETRVLDVLLDLPPTGRVQGSVSINGGAASGGRAILRPADQDPLSGGLSWRADCDALGRFAIPDVPAGTHTLVLYGATRQELYREPITVAANATAFVQVELATGGLRGRVVTTDFAPVADLLGYVWVLPGAAAEPADLYEYRRANRTHRIRVRNGTFEDSGLTPGPAIVVADIRDRKRSASKVVVPAGDMLAVELTAGARVQ